MRELGWVRACVCDVGMCGYVCLYSACGVVFIGQCSMVAFCFGQCPTMGFNHTTWMRLIKVPADVEGFRARFSAAVAAAWSPFTVNVTELKVRWCQTLASVGLGVEGG